MYQVLVKVYSDTYRIIDQELYTALVNMYFSWINYSEIIAGGVCLRGEMFSGFTPAKFAAPPPNNVGQIWTHSHSRLDSAKSPPPPMVFYIYPLVPYLELLLTPYTSSIQSL